MDSKKYWRAREEVQRQKDIKDADKYAGKIREIYQRAYFNIQDQINAFYTKYATETGLSMAEVKKKVSSLDIERYNKLAEKYVRNKDLSQMANEAMRIYNLTMKINRLEMLKSEIGMELASNFSDVEGLFNEALNKTATDEIERQAGILGKTVVDTAKKADSIVNSSFNNATFSDRIWMHQEALRQDLNRVISNSIIQGKHPRTFIKDIVDRFDVSKSQADRLLITEVCRVQTEVQKQSYERDGYAEYEFIAEPTACPICKGLDGHIYKVAKMMPGENAPPLHPRCRCSTAPYMDRAEFDKWLENYGKGNEESNSTRVYEKITKQEFLKMKHTISKEERKILYGKGHFSGYINSSNARKLNEIVRVKGPESLPADYKEIYDTMKAVIARNTVGKDIIVYRHVHPDAFKDMTGVDFFKPSLKKSNEESWKELNDIAKKVKIGHEYKERAFLSTSGVEDKNVMRDKQIHMEIKVKKETSAYVTTNKKESEIIFDQPSVIIKEVIVNDDWSVTIKGEMK